MDVTFVDLLECLNKQTVVNVVNKIQIIISTKFIMFLSCYRYIKLLVCV